MEKILKLVLETHGHKKAEKYIQEIFWRTYWKGWLEHRPDVYSDYLLEKNKLYEEFKNKKYYLNVINANTNLSFFNDWVNDLKNNGYLNLLTEKRADLDLTDKTSVKKWYKVNKPDVVIISAAKVGGILANSNFPVEFLLDNLKIQDLTGAGDLFAAGFLYGHIKGLSNLECLNKGREMSSKIIQQIGARL